MQENKGTMEGQGGDKKRTGAEGIEQRA